MISDQNQNFFYCIMHYIALLAKLLSENFDITHEAYEYDCKLKMKLHEQC